MRKKAKKLLAFLLCLMMLVPTMGLSAFASSKTSSSSGSSSSQSSISDISAILNALSYDEYVENVLNKHNTVGNMTLYSQLGEELGTATVVDGVASVLVYNGVEYSLKKQGKSTYVTLSGTYTGSTNVKADGQVSKYDIAVTIDADKCTAKIVETITQTIDGKKVVKESTVNANYTVVDTIEIVMDQKYDNQFDLLKGVYSVGGNEIVLGDDADRIKENVCFGDKTGDDNGIYLGATGVVTWSFEVPENMSGNYVIEIKYTQSIAPKSLL